MDNTFSEKTVWEDDDDLVCEYDSTWEETDTDSDEENSTRKYWGGKHTAKKKRGYSWRRNLWAAEDMQVYRHGYPKKYEPSDQNSQSDMDLKMVNLLFYRNVIPSSPDDVYIDQFHTHWKGDYERLERVHSYIQWLFPLQEAGMNDCALELTKKEIKAFCEDEEAKQRLVTSYELMLDFYGIELIDKVTGEVKRSEKWMARFKNLNRNTHNNLRITRILKCLGELGFQHYQAPLVHFFLTETLMLNNLGHVKQSVLDYFLFTVRDKKKRRELIKYAFRHYNPKDVFLWCPRKIQVTLLEEAEKKLDDPAPEEIGLIDEHNGSTSVGPALKELVTPESSQDEGTEAMIESSRVPSESQPNGQGVEKNGTTDDTPTLEQESTLEKQNEEEKEQMAGEPSNSLAGVIPHPPERAMLVQSGKRSELGLRVGVGPQEDMGSRGLQESQDLWVSGVKVVCLASMARLAFLKYSAHRSDGCPLEEAPGP
ncbi:hypothetical protein AAFF_G00142180 [Aldrovandia affinis]|uniref:Opioid growth factor receptor (OGFr) conserved domain-containing protein n=1 Tax=Aldrovandia affinis TaxID=143900 RepID=A0AAD7T233_9TELE|nr:hypothetical protein AAFF_G00142180 [Aldrovandia affinis]